MRVAIKYLNIRRIYKMVENKNDETILFPKESVYQIGKTTYVITSHYDDASDSLPQKIKKLLKAEIRSMLCKNL